MKSLTICYIAYSLARRKQGASFNITSNAMVQYTTKKGMHDINRLQFSWMRWKFGTIFNVVVEVYPWLLIIQVTCLWEWLTTLTSMHPKGTNNDLIWRAYIMVERPCYEDFGTFKTLRCDISIFIVTKVTNLLS